jgi:hypothetical protein
VVFAAFVVPGNDPISMSALAVVLIVLYEVAVQVSKAHDRRKAKEAEATSFTSLPDDVASPLPVTGTSAEAAGDVGTPEPVPAAEPVTAGESPGSSAGGSRADRWADSGDATSSLGGLPQRTRPRSPLTRPDRAAPAGVTRWMSVRRR